MQNEQFKSFDVTTSVSSLPGMDRRKLEQWIMAGHDDLLDALSFFTLGGDQSLPAGTIAQPFARLNGYSGYEYFLNGNERAEVGFAPLRWGGFTLHKVFSNESFRREVWEIYSESGKLQSVDDALFLDILYVDSTDMDPRCSILSHLYGYLSYEYDQAQMGAARPAQMRTIETFLRSLSIAPIQKDKAILNAWKNLKEAELHSSLSWEERQKVLENLFQERDKIVRVKNRAHQRSSIFQGLALRLGDWKNRFERLLMRPVSNIQGFSYKYTIGVLIWFLKTVRGNIGYSMALAIYGPFTFYFITQPLNPHAMWAVGRVRSAYLETTETLSKVFSGAIFTESSSSPEIAPPNTDTPKATEVAPIVTKDEIGIGMPISTEYKQVDEQSWSDRMSNFKNMQIGYEENMQFAARMGRLEQMELQLNFSMIADSTWEEIERYLDQLSSLSASIKNPSPELVQFFKSEEMRARRAEMYIWDKLLRYILDHPYVVMDSSKEQVYRDYYMGRSIILLRDMTRKLAAREKNFKQPADYKRLEAVAAAFEKTRVEGASVMDRLKKNTKLFAQADHTDGTALRAYMKRQWEVLYLLQNKAQEASNFGLQTYTWSVRNAVWLLQSLYSAKRRELSLLFESPNKPKANIAREIRTQIEPLYEQLVHMLSLEFASIRPELTKHLSNDIEANQRVVLIQSVEDFLKDREQTLVRMIQ